MPRIAHPDFTRDGDFQRLAGLDGAARQAPLALRRVVGTAHQQHAPAIDDDGADTDEGACRMKTVVTHRSSLA